jgi:hypothetical protein
MGARFLAGTERADTDLRSKGRHRRRACGGNPFPRRTGRCYLCRGSHFVQALSKIRFGCSIRVRPRNAICAMHLRCLTGRRNDPCPCPLPHPAQTGSPESKPSTVSAAVSPFRTIVVRHRGRRHGECTRMRQDALADALADTMPDIADGPVGIVHLRVDGQPFLHREQHQRQGFLRIPSRLLIDRQAPMSPAPAQARGATELLVAVLRGPADRPYADACIDHDPSPHPGKPRQ